jgi:hypothetical protein
MQEAHHSKTLEGGEFVAKLPAAAGVFGHSPGFVFVDNLPECGEDAPFRESPLDSKEERGGLARAARILAGTR